MKNEYEIKSYHDGYFKVSFEVVTKGTLVPFKGKFNTEVEAKEYLAFLENRSIDPELRLWAISECQSHRDESKERDCHERAGKYKKLLKFLKGL